MILLLFGVTRCSIIIVTQGQGLDGMETWGSVQNTHMQICFSALQRNLGDTLSLTCAAMPLVLVLLPGCYAVTKTYYQSFSFF